MERFIASLLLLTGTLHAQVVINDFSGAQDSYTGWLYQGLNGTSSSSVSGLSGQVDTGYFTINDSAQNGYFGIYSSGTGNTAWSLPSGYTDTTGDLNLLNVSGFLVSLRREANNSAPLVYLELVDNTDISYQAPINLGSLSTGSFTDIFLPLSAFNLTYSSGLMAWQIGIRGDYNNGDPQTYNFSLDSVRAVPEPSAVSLLAVGLAGLIALRRRKEA